jgi:hypothetical protein
LAARREALAGRPWSPGRTKRSAAASTRRRGALTKSQQRERDAQALGITVEELKARRSAEAAEGAALAAEARRRGIKVKQLRKLIASGKVAPPTVGQRTAPAGHRKPTARSTPAVVSKTGRAR